MYLPLNDFVYATVVVTAFSDNNFLQEMLQREKEAEYFKEWEKQEDKVCTM